MRDSTGQSFFPGALARARVCRAQGDVAGALRELRAGLEAEADYTSAVTAARFLENTAQSAPPAGWPVRRTALIGSGGWELLRPVVRALAFRDGWWPEFFEAPFGTWRQQILDPHSALREFKPDVTVVLRSWRDAEISAIAASQAEAERLLAEELALVRLAAGGLGLVLWPGFDFPPANNPPDFRHPVLSEFNQRLSVELPPGILPVDLAGVQAAVGAAWEDERWREAVAQYPSAAGSLPLVEAWLALLRARWGLSKKVLVTDLDNTLWGGIVGEDGVEGVRIGPGSPEGEAYLAYQKYLLELKSRGVLLTVCSKNNEADATEVFARRQMPLRREDFVAWAVNWDDKAGNLRTLAGTLQLGLDSFVFIDDSPMERALIRSALPEVSVPEWNGDLGQLVARLQQRRLFYTLSLTEEDRGRQAAYRANERRAQMQAGTSSLEDFLRGLEMTCEHGPFSAVTMDRVEQLLARTNQWNLTTRRHGRADLERLGAQSGTLTQWFRLRDRFGDNGLVGLWIAIPRKSSGLSDGGDWEIDTWLMSCRVIGRGLEDLMFNTLVEMLRARGGRRLFAVYRPTTKNNLVADLLPNFGFSPVKNDPATNEQTFVLVLENAGDKPNFIQATKQPPA